jgi:putative membrane protein
MSELLGILIALFLGCLAGILTGLAPGIHVNTVAAGVLAGLGVLTAYFSPLALGVFLVAMVIMHSFVDFIPSIFLGAPDDGETALSVLPGHKLLLAGKGYTALKLTVIGGIGSTIIGLALLPVFSLAIFYGYDKLGIAIPILILAFSAFFIWLEKSLKGKIWALIVFMMSGVLGIIALGPLSIKEPLFPMLTGLFGTSTIIISLMSKDKIVEQDINTNLKFRGRWLTHLKASVSAALMSVLPALGAAQATVLAQAATRKERDDKDFLVMVGGINTVSSLFVLTTLFFIGRARTGVLATMKQFLELNWASFAVLLAASLIAIAISAIVTLWLGKIIAKRIAKIKYRKLSFFVLIILILLAGFFGGLLGLFVLSVSTAIGLIAPKVGIKRIHAMGCLAIPIVLYFI